jgi:hypothetical protein
MAIPQPPQSQPSQGNDGPKIPDTSHIHEKESLLSDSEHAFNVTHAATGEVGTIVTDKRRKRQSLFGVIKDAANEWTTENAEAVKGLEVFQKPVIPKVIPGSERKEIIEKAVMTPQAEAQDDHKVMIERIKTFKTDAERVTGRPFIIKKEGAQKKKGWSHIIGDEKEDEKELPSSGKNFPEVQHIHREDVTSQAHNQPVAPTVRTRVHMDLPPLPKQDTEPVTTTSAPQPEPYVPPAPKPIAPPESIAEPVLPAKQAPEKIPESEPAQQKPEKEAVQRPNIPTEPDAVLNAIRPRFAFVAAIAIVMLLALGGIGTGAYLFLNREPVVAGVVVPAFVKADERQVLAFSNDRTKLLTDLRTNIDSSNAEFLHLYFIFEKNSDGVETLVMTQDFFGVLQPRTSGAFMRSLDERMMLGGVSVSEMEPFMLLKSNAFDTAFAGMLEWEAFMSADLAPFFGEPVSRSFNPDARSSNRTTALAFADKTIANHNVRVLYDEAGNERIVYGFVNRNTIIITSTGAAFEKILGALQ